MARVKGKASACLVLSFILLLSIFLPYSSQGFHSLTVSAAEDENESVEEGFPEINAHAGVLMEHSTENIIFSQNGKEQMPPASLTKIMTILMTYKAVEEGRASWDDIVEVSERAWRQGGSQMFLNVGQEVSLKELTKGVIIVSANDACVAIAEHLSGSEEIFVQEMNEKAGELGLKNTRFQNTSGLPEENHYTSPEDTAKIAKHLVDRFPEALELYSTPEFTFNDIKQENRNPLLGRFPGADGIKTGYTSEAGYNLAGSAERDGMRFISVVMKAESNNERLKDSQNLLNYGFQNYTLYTAFSKNEKINTAAVSRGVEREVDLLTHKDIEAVVPLDRKDELEFQLDIPNEITAPVDKGEPLGHLEIVLDDEVLSKTELYAAENIERAGIFTLVFRSIGDFFSSLWEEIAESISNLFRSIFSSD